MLHLEITEVILVHCNIVTNDYQQEILVHCNLVNNDYQQDSTVLHTFVLNKSVGQLLDISSKNFIFLKTFEVWFPDQNSELLETEYKINITLFIN